MRQLLIKGVYFINEPKLFLLYKYQLLQYYILLLMIKMLSLYVNTQDTLLMMSFVGKLVSFDNTFIGAIIQRSNYYNDYYSPKPI